MELDKVYMECKNNNWGLFYELYKTQQLSSLAGYKNEHSGWTFLHQAVYWSEIRAIKMMQRAFGGPRFRDLLQCRDSQGRTVESLSVPASENWSIRDKVKQRRAEDNMIVYYMGRLVYINIDDVYYVDDENRVIIGWHGTNPPRDMDGELVKFKGVF